MDKTSTVFDALLSSNRDYRFLICSDILELYNFKNITVKMHVQTIKIKTTCGLTV
jgi:hypothetical protein